jgi:hypothetical protein
VACSRGAANSSCGARREDWSHANQQTQGWQAIEDSIRLSGWTKTRRVVVLRRRIKHDVALTAKQDDGQMVLALPHDGIQERTQLWECTVLVTRRNDARQGPLKAHSPSL